MLSSLNCDRNVDLKSEMNSELNLVTLNSNLFFWGLNIFIRSENK